MVYLKTLESECPDCKCHLAYIVAFCPSIFAFSIWHALIYNLYNIYTKLWVTLKRGLPRFPVPAIVPSLSNSTNRNTICVLPFFFLSVTFSVHDRNCQAAYDHFTKMQSGLKKGCGVVGAHMTLTRRVRWLTGHGVKPSYRPPAGEIYGSLM